MPTLQQRRVVLAADVLTPLGLPGLVAWWRGDDLAATLADGAAVSSWASFFGSASAAQATGSKQPLFKLASVNGHSSVLFDGVDDALVTGALGAFSNTNLLSIIAVLREPTHTGARAVGFSWAGGFSGNTDGAGLGYNSATNPNGFFRNAAGSSNSASGGTIVANTWHGQAVTNDGGTTGPITYLDGTKVTQSGGASGTPTTHNSITLGGAVSGTSGFGHVEIPEVICCSAAVSAALMARLHAEYLKSKYGLS